MAMSIRPIDVVRKVAPNARAEYLAAIENGDALFLKHQITTPLRLAHFLAQCLHETGGFHIAYESGNYRAARIMEIFGVGRHSAAVTASEAERLAGNGPALFERVYGLGNPKKAQELGNVQPGDGWRYRGCGIMQTTGRDNYRRMGQRCGVDFETYPELVIAAEHALKPALAEWTEGNLNAAADRDDIRAITKRINGGYNGLADREEWLRRVSPLIDGVALRPAPMAPAAPAPVTTPTAPISAETKTASTAVATGAVVAATAKAAGAENSSVAIIIIGALVVAAIAFFIIRKRRK